jgi:hypothetical protein
MCWCVPCLLCPSAPLQVCFLFVQHCSPCMAAVHPWIERSAAVLEAFAGTSDSRVHCDAAGCSGCALVKSCVSPGYGFGRLFATWQLGCSG